MGFRDALFPDVMCILTQPECRIVAFYSTAQKKRCLKGLALLPDSGRNKRGAIAEEPMPTGKREQT